MFLPGFFVFAPSNRIDSEGLSGLFGYLSGESYLDLLNLHVCILTKKVYHTWWALQHVLK